MTATFTAMMDPGLALGAVVADFPRADRCSDVDWEPVIAAVQATRAATGQPMAIIASLAENMPEPVAQRLIGMGIAPLCGMDDALDAIALAAQARPNAAPLPLLLPHAPTGVQVLSEAEGKLALAGYGVSVPLSARAALDGVAQAADRVGFPLVLKGEGIAHKTEAGAVVLGLGSVAAVQDAATRMPCDSFLLEEMIGDGVAELLVGVVRDGAHGYVLTIAAGGTLTELLRDSASLLLPCNADDIRAAIQSLAIARVLAGHRGKPAADMTAIVQAVLAVQDYVIAHHGQIEEAEINPLICTPTRAVAADVLISIGENDD